MIQRYLKIIYKTETQKQHDGLELIIDFNSLN